MLTDLLATIIDLNSSTRDFDHQYMQLTNMTTAEVQIPPSNRVVPGSRLIPYLELPSPVPESTVSPESIVSDWILSFSRFIKGDNVSATRLFMKESCWRDLLCSSWNFRTFQGPQQISSFIESSPREGHVSEISLDRSAPYKDPQLLNLGDFKVIQAFLKVKTSVGRGEGLVRLVSDVNDGGLWKALTFFTTLKEIEGHEEIIHNRRPTGLSNGEGNESVNWKDRLTAQQNLENGREPTVLIIGRSFKPELCFR